VTERGVQLRILLVGERFSPFRTAGDKNFWLDMIQGLRGSGHDVETLSVDVEPVPENDLSIRLVRQVPIYFRPDKRFNPEHRHVAASNNYVSKTMTLPILLRALRRRQREFRPDVIHFADNFGPGMIAVRRACGAIPLTISAPTYQRNRPLYDRLLLASFQSFDVIVPFSDAYRTRLLELGVPPRRIRRIRWGIDVHRFAPPTQANREAARVQLGIAVNSFVVLWTGFTQQTNVVDLEAAQRAASLALGHGPLEFVFCFKPEHFRASYKRLERPGLRVVSTAESFHAARTAADLFLAPIQDPRSTAAPPLVWPEMLAMGVPILTTQIPGTGEAVVDGVSGFTVRTPEDAMERIREIQEDPTLHQRLREGARRIAEERFSATRARDEYVDLWTRLVRQPP